MVANFSTVAGPGPAEAATPCTAAALTKAAPPTAASNRLILRISHPLPGTPTARPAGPCVYRSHVLLARQVQPGHKGPQAQVELPRVRPLRRHPTPARMRIAREMPRDRARHIRSRVRK